MSREGARKIGLFSALAVVVGMVVGIGVFFKNGSVLKSQDLGDGTFSFWSLIATWIVSAVIVMCSALSFAQISTCMTSKAGIAGWAERLSNRRVGRHVKYNHCVFYLGTLCAVFPFLSIEGLITAVGYGVGDPSTIHFGYTFLFGVILIGSVFALNFFSQKWSTRFQNVAASIKFIPIAAVIIVGLIGLNKTHVLDAGASDLAASPVAGQYGPDYLVPNTKAFSVDGMFVALPLVFFTFDSYTNVGNVAPFVRSPQRNVPIALVAGVVFAAAIYILLAIGSGLTGFGTAQQILASLVPDGAVNAAQAKEAVAVVVNVFVTVSALSVTNGMIGALLKSSSGLVETGEIMGWRFYARVNQRRAGCGDLLLAVLMTAPVTAIVGTVGVVMNNDSVAGSLSNFPTLYFMMVYAFITVLAMVDAKTKRLCRPVRGFWAAAPIAVLGALMSFCYLFFYQYLYLVAANSADVSNAAGLFYGNSPNPLVAQTTWLNRDDAIVFWVSLAVFICAPFVNHAVIMRTGGYKPRAEDQTASAGALRKGPSAPGDDLPAPSAPADA